MFTTGMKNACPRFAAAAARLDCDSSGIEISRLGAFENANWSGFERGRATSDELELSVDKLGRTGAG